MPLVLEHAGDRYILHGKMTDEERKQFENDIRSDRQLIRWPQHLGFDALRVERRFHEMVLINGKPEIGEGTQIGIFSEVYDKGGVVSIGRHCDVASFCSINAADSHARCIGRSTSVAVAPITIGDHVFIGSHSFIGGGVSVGHHSVIAAGTILRGRKKIPPYSLVWGNPARVKKGYYARKT